MASHLANEYDRYRSVAYRKGLKLSLPNLLEEEQAESLPIREGFFPHS